MTEQERWLKVQQIVEQAVNKSIEETVRRVIREELASLRKKPQISFENGRFVGVSEEQMTAWGAAYEGIDIAAELKKMAAWCVSNPHLAPKSQWGRFVNTWLVRHHNQASLRRIPVRDAPAKQDTCAYCGVPSVGSVNGYKHCREHGSAAMDAIRPLAAVRGA